MKKKIQLKKEVISQLDDNRLLQVKGGTAAGTRNCPSDTHGFGCVITANGESCVPCDTYTSGPMLCELTLHTCDCRSDLAVQTCYGNTCWAMTCN